MAHNEAHNALVRAALQELALKGYTAWENETGVWFEYYIKNGKLEKGRAHAYGKVGSGDIFIVLPPHGRHIEAEAKTGAGRQSENQKLHQKYAVERNGGAYILFRSAPELMQKLADL
jgi:hypothetical protein